MHKKAAIIIVALVIVAGISLLVLLQLQGFLSMSKNVQVSSLQIQPSSDWSSCNLKFTVSNLYTSQITAIGSNVNAVNYGYSNLPAPIPPGQAQDENINLPNLIITNSTEYAVQLSFSFGNSQYQVYSQNLLTKRYVGAFFMTNESLTLQESNRSIYSVTIQNTGNIPIVSVNYTISSKTSVNSGSVGIKYSTVVVQSVLPLKESLMAEESVALVGQPIVSSSIQKGSSYSVIIQVGYADKNTSSVQGSLSILDLSTPAPSATPAPVTPSLIPSAIPSSTVAPIQTAIHSPTAPPNPTPEPELTFTLVSNATTNLIGQKGADISDSVLLTATLSDPTISGQATLYYGSPIDNFNYQTNGTLTNGVFTQIIKLGKADPWQFKVFWQGDAQHNSIYSNLISLYAWVK